MDEKAPWKSSTETSNLVLVHVGAGRHLVRNREKLEKMVRNACRQGRKRGLQLDDVNGIPVSSLESLAKAARIVEASPLTNCGYGSSLTSLGTVFNDAHVVLRPGKSFRKSCAALTCIQMFKYPIIRCINFLMLGEIEDNTRSLGVIKPNFLIDNNIDYFGNKTNTGQHTLFDDGHCVSSDLVSTHAKRQFEYWSLVKADQEKPGDHLENLINDTIGILIQDNNGNIVQGVSSGGNMMKPEGRVGCAAVMGASSYTMRSEDLPYFDTLIEPTLKQTSTENQLVYQLSCLALGNGEDIVATDLCRYCCNYILSHLHLDSNLCDAVELLEDAISKAADSVQLQAKVVCQKRKFSSESKRELPYVGIVGVLKSFDYKTRTTIAQYTIYAHTTETFVFGVFSASEFDFIFSENSAPRHTETMLYGGVSTGQIKLDV